MKKTRHKKVRDIISELQKLPPQSKISIDVWNRVTEEWDRATPIIYQDSLRNDRYVISYDPEEVEGTENG